MAHATGSPDDDSARGSDDHHENDYDEDGDVVRRAVVLSLAILAIAGGCQKRALTHNLNIENKVQVRPVTLYFEGPEMLLVRDARNVALPENPAGALSDVTKDLLKG